VALSIKVKTLLNAALKPVNVKVDSLTVDRAEAERLLAHEQSFGFDAPVYALPPGIAEFDATPLREGLAAHGGALARLKDPARNDTGYTPGNGYYESPDADVLYLMIRRFAPKQVVEVGCGNSTRVTRQAIRDGRLATRLVAIDPQPRADIAHLVDRFVQARVETAPIELFSELEAGDVLFIDSSHELRVGNDVAHLFCQMIPMLARGVIIHVHDIFLPYEYPELFFFGYPSWGEQYILHALISGSGYEILWPGHYIQRARPELAQALPFLAEGLAQSFWMRKR
jgi:predicted O-methyltransferase YrrM